MRDSMTPLSVFHLSGNRLGTELEDIAGLDLRPALFTGFEDLSRLRHDYPLVLVADAADAAICPLSEAIDDALRAVATPDPRDERLRRLVLRVEREIRALVGRGHKGTLTQLWRQAEGEILARIDEAARPEFADDLGRARAALRIDGRLIDCDDEAPVQAVTHAWIANEAKKERRLRDTINTLVIGLTNILKADAMKSNDAVGAGFLERSFGAGFAREFDFDVMSRVLSSAQPDGALSDGRRRRIQATLSTLRAQKFCAMTDGQGEKTNNLLSFVFEHCREAIEAYRERRPAMIETAKSMIVARLEIENRYQETRHDSLFRQIDERLLENEDLAMLPSYLVRVRNGASVRDEMAALTEILQSDAPIKVLVQHDDISVDPSLSHRASSSDIDGVHLATMALGFETAFVLQATAANLGRVGAALDKGLASPGPALFSVYSGSSARAPTRDKQRNVCRIAPYLRAAAAMDSRAMPILIHDPTAGDDWASRLSIGGNPQAETDWPVHRLEYEGGDMRRLSSDIAMTFVDFAALDGRYASEFAKVPRPKWHDGMIPASEFLDVDPDTAAHRVPYILMIDGNNGLHRIVVTNRVIEAAKKCRARWRSLQELAGIKNSRVMRALAAEKRDLDAEKARTSPAAPGRSATEGARPPATAEKIDFLVPAPIPDRPAAPSGAPYIETPRCTSCDECTQINNRMFAYDDNKQAYVANPDAGTYRQLVEAAESCQVAIVHPGLPRNPNESGLAELVERAKLFN
jgi:ferredoxin